MGSFPVQTMNLTSSLKNALFTNFRTEFNRALAIQSAFAKYKLVATTLKGTTDTEKMPLAFLPTSMKKWLGSRQFGKIALDEYEMVPVDFENSIVVGENELADDKLQYIIMRIQELAKEAAFHPDQRLGELVADHLKSSPTTTEFPVGFDGKALFSTTHAWSNGFTTSQSNLRTGSSTGKLDMANGQANLEGAITSLTNFKSAAETQMRSRATHLLVPPNLIHNARRLLNSQQMILGVTGTESSATVTDRGNLNPLAEENIAIVMMHDWPASKWALADLSGPMKPFIYLERQKLRFRKDESRLFTDKELLYGVDSRIEFGVGPWWKIVGGDGT